jgi:hypothetical protein
MPAPANYVRSNRIAVISMLGPDVNYRSSFSASYEARSGGASRLHRPEWNIDDNVVKIVTDDLQAEGYQVKRFIPEDAADLPDVLNDAQAHGYDTVMLVDTNTPYHASYPGYGFYRSNSMSNYNTAAYATIMLHVFQKGVKGPASFGDGENALTFADSDPVSLMWRDDFNLYSSRERKVLERSMHILLDRKVTEEVDRFMRGYYYSLSDQPVGQSEDDILSE